MKEEICEEVIYYNIKKALDKKFNDKKLYTFERYSNTYEFGISVYKYTEGLYVFVDESYLADIEVDSWLTSSETVIETEVEQESELILKITDKKSIIKDKSLYKFVKDLLKLNKLDTKTYRLIKCWEDAHL